MDLQTALCAHMPAQCHHDPVRVLHHTHFHCEHPFVLDAGETINLSIGLALTYLDLPVIISTFSLYTNILSQQTFAAVNYYSTL